MAHDVITTQLEDGKHRLSDRVSFPVGRATINVLKGDYRSIGVVLVRL